jgi:hypothetical protein
MAWSTAFTCKKDLFGFMFACAEQSTFGCSAKSQLVLNMQFEVCFTLTFLTAAPTSASVQAGGKIYQDVKHSMLCMPCCSQVRHVDSCCPNQLPNRLMLCQADNQLKRIAVRFCMLDFVTASLHAAASTCKLCIPAYVAAKAWPVVVVLLVGYARALQPLGDPPADMGATAEC